MEANHLYIGVIQSPCLSHHRYSSAGHASCPQGKMLIASFYSEKMWLSVRARWSHLCKLAPIVGCQGGVCSALGKVWIPDVNARRELVHLRGHVNNSDWVAMIALLCHPDVSQHDVCIITEQEIHPNYKRMSCIGQNFSA